MLSYTLRRLALMVPTLFGITLVTFLLINLAPGDPVEVMNQGQIQKGISPEAYDAMLELYGLDEPILVRYGIWLRRLVTLDFGDSFREQRPVLEMIAERLPATLQLNIAALVLAVLIALPIGLQSAVKQNSLFDKFGGTVLYMLYSLPEFWVALLLIMLFGVKLGWLPLYGIASLNADDMSTWGRVVDRVRHMVLPVICLTYGSLAYLSRFVRGSTLEIIRQDYVRTARAKGLATNKVIYRHVLRNSLIPVLTLLGLLLPTVISGSVVLELVFSWPGVGKLFLDSVLARDYPTVMGLSFLTAVLVLISTLLADLLYAWADPRVSYR